MLKNGFYRINLDKENPQLSTNFKASEFRSKDREANDSKMVFIDAELIDMLQKLRDYLNKPVNIHSGFRTANHNKDCGGVPDSQHMYGTAADVKVTGISPLEVCRAMEKLGFKGIGLYNTFSHGDVRTDPAKWNSTSGKEVSVKSFL